MTSVYVYTVLHVLHSYHHHIIASSEPNIARNAEFSVEWDNYRPLSFSDENDTRQHLITISGHRLKVEHARLPANHNNIGYRRIVPWITSDRMAAWQLTRQSKPTAYVQKILRQIMFYRIATYTEAKIQVKIQVKYVC